VKKRVLLVDDDPAIREAVGSVLTGERYEVTSVGDGQEALEVAANRSVDLVLLDLNLPKKDGWDTFEMLTRQNPCLPVIIITARSNQLFPALAVGAGALIEKPLDVPKLLQTIRNLLAEPMETRAARLAGKPTEFHYLPASVADG